MTLIAISHRSSDREVAQALYQRFARLAGPQRVFLAELSVPAGTQWSRRLEEAFAQAALVVAVVGSSWAVDEHGSPRFGPNDYVLRELETARAGRCRVMVPVLLGGTRAPTDTERAAWPEAAQDLFRHQARPLGLPLSTGEIRSLCDEVFDIALRAGTGVIATHSRFPTARITEALAVANSRFLVWHTWTEYFGLDLRDSLVRFLSERFVSLGQPTCRILLAHSSCDFASERAGRLKQRPLADLVQVTLNELAASGEQVRPGGAHELVEVRFYSPPPTMPLYVVDDLAFVGWYPSADRSLNSPFLEIDAQRGDLIQKLEAEFTRSWQNAPWQWCFRCRSEVPVNQHVPTGTSALQEL